MKKDNIYKDTVERIQPFKFNSKVVDVFDDMINRSVPLYQESIKRQAEIAAEFYQEGSVIYDLGCSSGNVGLTFLDKMGKKKFNMVAVDNSKEMIDEYKKRLSNKPKSENINFLCDDIRDISFENASVVIINLTLQFIPLADRDSLVKRIYDSMLSGGVIILTEKTVHKDKTITDLQQNFYYLFKKENGYSNLEISQKRDALENVLIPETPEDHIKRLNNSGFKETDIWLKWFNFASFIGIK
ncbi:MAG: carboxy-S-adenosyl-L-methionine synthase CmoA [Desulfobacterales bacterium]|nr:carboxy-S-adenosyl-L-methionine synthase CmoA [Desulfobacterales bacterium]